MQARQRSLKVIDATCPLVTKVHLEAVKFARNGFTIVLIGHKDHDEVIGTLGEAPKSTALVSTVEDVDRLEVPDPERVSFITQTTLSVDDTRAWQQTIPDSELLVLPGDSYHVAASHAVQCAQAALTFIERRDPDA